MKEKKSKEKNPRKTLTIVAVVVVLCVVGCVYNLVTTGSIGGQAGSSPGGGSTTGSASSAGLASSSGSASAQEAGSAAGSSSGVASEGGPLEMGYYTVPSGAELYFNPSVPDDVTGLWRIASTSDNYVPEENAVKYYRTFFSSDDEVHAVWNATLKTMTRITCSDGVVYATTLEYVDKEEHSAKTLFSGMKLSESAYNAETGEPVA